MTVWVCDWSEWQAAQVVQLRCPVEQIQAEGFGCVKLKVGGSIKKGWSAIDPSFLASWEPLQQTAMMPGAYWFLTPDNPRAQAGLFVDTLERCGGFDNWACWLDVEMPGVTGSDVFEFWKAWGAHTATQPLAMYTRRSFWSGVPDVTFSPTVVFPFLEEARWVPTTIRHNPAMPYASQQAKAIQPEWWDVGYGAGGWTRADMLQFTDNALVAGVRTVASVYQGTLAQLKREFVL